MIHLLGVFIGFTLLIGCGYGAYHIAFEWIKVDWLELTAAVLLGALCASGMLLGLFIVMGAALAVAES